MSESRSPAPDAQFIAALPKCELHLHLEGSLRPDTQHRLAERNGIATTREEVEQRFAFRDFDHFIELFVFGLRLFQRAEDFADAVEALAIELAGQNVRYAEVTSTAFSHNLRGVPMSEYVDGLNTGRRIARERHGVEIGWVIDIPRELEPPHEAFTASFLTGPRPPDGVVGIGLGGPEVGFPAELFAASFDRARAAGLRSLPHAGETQGPASVRAALDTLGAERIGHGVRSIDDPELVRELVDRGIHLEVSITSNVLLGVAPDVARHPFPRLRDAGVSVGINTDDPAYFATTLTREIRIAADAYGLTRADLVGLQRAAFEASSLPGDWRRALLAELDAVET
jgi:aminodeoxyfutalosine deaminase